jgi:GDP-mannose 6-dehydrogenase
MGFMASPHVRLSVFGLGYVGTVSAACFAGNGFPVVGVDPQRFKAPLTTRPPPPTIAPGRPDLTRGAVAAARLRATTDPVEAIAESDLSFVCVGTPSHPDGGPDLSNVAHVCEQIGAALRRKAGRHTVVVRSTVLPGTMRRVVQPTLERASGKAAGTGFGLSHNPEFLREGSAVADFYNPPKTVVGAGDRQTAAAVGELYSGIDAPLIDTSIEVAELVKYVDNAWHALKVAFGNEVGNLSKALGIDSHAVMDIMCMDTKLNLSRAYLRPGFAFGGSCLPKDLRGLLHQARTLHIDLPVLGSILPSNRLQLERAVRLVLDKGCRKVGVLGFSFKAGTDDLRESPLVDLIERLIGKGLDLRLFDRNVNLAKLVGANRDYILNRIPHIAALMVDSLEEALEHGEVIVVGNNDPAFHDVAGRLGPDQILIDMVRVPERAALGPRYEGINW